jgi:transposase
MNVEAANRVISDLQDRRAAVIARREATAAEIEGIGFAARLWVRAIATRYDKTARNFLAAVHLAAAIIWLG